MKDIVGKDFEIGADGGQGHAALVVEDGMLKIKGEAGYPVQKIVAPLALLVDKFLDKVEQLLPGDQKALAEKLKAEAHEELGKLFAKAVSLAAEAHAAEPEVTGKAPEQG